MALFEHENECVCSYTISVVFAVILLTISIEIGTYFVCFRWLLMLSLVPELKRQFDKCNSLELNNGKSKKNRDQKSNLLFLQRHDLSQKFGIKLVRNIQKALQRD